MLCMRLPLKRGQKHQLVPMLQWGCWQVCTIDNIPWKCSLSYTGCQGSVRIIGPYHNFLNAVAFKVCRSVFICKGGSATQVSSHRWVTNRDFSTVVNYGSPVTFIFVLPVFFSVEVFFFLLTKASYLANCFSFCYYPHRVCWFFYF